MDQEWFLHLADGGIRDGWRKIEAIFKRYRECGVNEGCIRRCDGVVSCVRKHGV